MKYIFTSITNQIKTRIPMEQEELLVKISGFEDLNVYVKSAECIKAFADESQIKCTIKLAQNKYNKFSNNPNNKELLEYMHQRDWLADNNSITSFRNSQNQRLLVLMGTEGEDDKDGLRNCFEITPESLFEDLDENYINVFPYLISFFDDKEIQLFNKMYKDLFEFVPADICLLSNVSDSWANQIENFTDFCELFFKSLDLWGLPKRINNIPSMSQLEEGNFIRPEYNFINLISFKKLSKKDFLKNIQKIDTYNTQHKEFCETWEGWQTQPIKTYKEYTDCLLSFIQGKDVEKCKSLLIKCDYAIAESILNLKIEDGPGPKTTPVKTINGEPLCVFTRAILYSISNIAKKHLNVSKIVFDIQQVELYSGFSGVDNDDEEEALKNAWNNFRLHVNGIFEKITSREWTINNQAISFELKPEGVFELSNSVKLINDNLVKAMANSQMINKVVFVVKIYDDNGNPIDETEEIYKWTFTNNSEWLNDYSLIIDPLFFNNINVNSEYIPLLVAKSIKELAFAKSEEEFFDSYIDMDIDSSFNIVDYISKEFSSAEDADYKAKFIKLGICFKTFCSDIYEKGFYKSSNEDNSSITNLIKAYIELGKLLCEKRLPQNKRSLYDAYINAFNIVDNTEFLEKNKIVNQCIVCPWHPVTLQKKLNRAVFFLDGCIEWYNSNKDTPNPLSITEINKQINLLEQLSKIRNSVVLFPGKQSFFGNTNSFGSYSIYSDSSVSNNARVKDLIQKDAIFDDDFNDSDFKYLSEDSKMLLKILQSYSKAFFYTKNILKLVFINPKELQSVVSAVYHYVVLQRKKSQNDLIRIELNILVKPENKGGKNYLAYWMDNFFSEDENISVKIYLNEWHSYKDLATTISMNNDLIFVMDFLEATNYKIIEDNSSSKNVDIGQCLFPIVYKPQLMSKTSVKRRIELSQKQFPAEYIHTQVLNARDEIYSDTSKNYMAIREVELDSDDFRIIDGLHEKSNWVVCIDSGLDGALLRKEAQSPSDYSIIGFSTGNGSYGQYNLTITARKEILDTIKQKFKSRLYQLFHWEADKIEAAATRCIKEATSLDGISLLSAINQKDNNINEFMAYVLTSYRERQKSLNSPLKILIHLDSYKHWFNDEIEEETDDKKSRPDFLMLEVKNYESDKIELAAKVIECKTADYGNAEEHLEKAKGQVEHGIKRLQSIFDPNSNSMIKRYWFAQLYRALAFAQVTFIDSEANYELISNKLRGILDGLFTITWDSEILGYWLNMNGDEEVVTSDEKTTIVNIPQKKIQKILLDNQNEEVSYSSISPIYIYDEAELEKYYQENEYIDESEACNSQSNDSIDKEKDIKESNSETSVDNNVYDTDSDLKEENNPHNDESIINNSVEPITTKLEDTRVLIGKEKNDSEVYWEFGNPKLNNRHLLITGSSGQGKTYCIQTMLYELSKSNVSSIIFDYTTGFTPEQLNKDFLQRMDNRLIQRIVIDEGIPINPFKPNSKIRGGKKVLEKSSLIADRMKNVFSHVYTFGPQQEAAVYEAIRDGIDQYGEKMNLKIFVENLKKINNSHSASVLSKMNFFFDSVEFNTDESIKWEQILYPEKPQCFVFQLQDYPRETQVVITELLLWDLFNYTLAKGHETKPFVVVLDEAQNLSHNSNSPSEKILTEGRKLGWSAWYATQSLQGLSDVEIKNLQQAGFKLNFKPTEAELPKIAKQLDPQNSYNLIGALKGLKKGQCIVVGDRCNSFGTFGPHKPTVTDVLSFDKRK